MGELDDAIRDHLELKRRRGADPAEVARQEHEALAPVTRSHPIVSVPQQELQLVRAEAYDHAGYTEDVYDPAGYADDDQSNGVYDHAGYADDDQAANGVFDRAGFDGERLPARGVFDHASYDHELDDATQEFRIDRGDPRAADWLDEVSEA